MDVAIWGVGVFVVLVVMILVICDAAGKKAPDEYLSYDEIGDALDDYDAATSALP